MRCSWGTCNSDYRYPERCVGIKFIPFVKPAKTKPWNHEKCLRWIKACGRPHEQLNINKVNKNHYICSKCEQVRCHCVTFKKEQHFVDGKPTIENPDPIQAITTNAESSSCRKRKLPMKRSHPTAPKMRKTEAAKILLSLQTSTPRVSDEPHTENSSSNVQLNSEQTSTGTSEQTEESHCMNGLPNKQLNSKTVTEFQQPREPTIDCSHCGNQIQVNATQLKNLQKNALKLHIMNNDQKCMEYTGVPSVALLKFLFQWLEKAASDVGPSKQKYGENRGSKSHKMSKFDCFLLTLMRIRKGFDVSHLSFIFNISASHVSRIFIAWVGFLSQCLKPLIKWPTQDVARHNMPSKFDLYPKTRCVIDCTELFIEKPFMPAAQKATWSNYKHRNTAKVLVGIHPCGTITFVSNLFVGSTSDQEIVKKSGFLDLVEKGDDIMADRGFNIRHLLLRKGATLNIPAFSRGKTLSEKAVQRSRNIASVRIHVERAIRRMKCFKILTGIIPIKMRFSLNKILIIVAALSYFDSPLCS